MSITTTYNYSSGSGFSYDVAKIGFSNDAAELILTDNPGQTFNPDLADSDYDPLLFELNAGAIRQKDTRPANFQNYFAWNTQLDGNYGYGTLTVTSINGAAIVENKLDLTGLTNKYVTLSSTAAIGNLGTAAFIYTPNYTGVPSVAQFIWCSGANLGNQGGLFLVFHNTDGGIYFYATDSTGTLIINLILGAWSPISGTSYTMTVQIDLINGASKLFIDGVQFGSTVMTTGDRGTLGWFRVGNDNQVTRNSNFSISNMVMYDAIVSPTNITPLNEYIYNPGTVFFPEFEYSFPVGEVVSWTSLAITDANMPRYVVNNKYWNGSAWVASNGTYAQATTAALVQTNIPTLPADETLAVNGVFQGSNTLQASTSEIDMVYVGEFFSTSNPTIAPTSYVSMDILVSFEAITDSIGLDGVKFYLTLNGTKYWFNGATWAVSSGAYTQSNFASEINDNASSLPISSGAFVIPFAVLHSDDGTTTPSITSLTIVSSYFGPAPIPPGTCTVFGYILDENQVPLVNAIVSVTNPTTFVNGSVVYAQGVRTATTNAQGYFDIELVETETMDVPATLTFSVTYTQAQVGTGFTKRTFSFGSAVIPNQPSENIAALTFV